MIGLTLGKYAPFHKGHQFVIETALAEMDHVIVLIYDAPEQTAIPLAVRAGWIRQIYAAVEVIECADGPREVGASAAIKRMHERYIMDKLAGREITAFYSSEFYGEHMAVALGATNRVVDADRLTVPVSATKIRAHPQHYADYLHPIVRKDFLADWALRQKENTNG